MQSHNVQAVFTATDEPFLCKINRLNTNHSICMCGVIFRLSLVASGVVIICQEIICRHIIFTHRLWCGWSGRT